MGFFMILLTLGISVWNAYAVGSSWPYARVQGGFGKLTAISGGVISGIGFSMVIAVVLMYLGATFNIVGPESLYYFSKLFPALIIVPMVLAGSIITISSWKYALSKNQGGFERMTNIALAGWNTYATASNIISMPGIFKRVFDSDDDRDITVTVLIIALLAIASGFAVSYFLIKYFSDKEMNKQMKMYQR